MTQVEDRAHDLAGDQAVVVVERPLPPDRRRRPTAYATLNVAVPATPAIRLRIGQNIVAGQDMFCTAAIAPVEGG